MSKDPLQHQRLETDSRPSDKPVPLETEPTATIKQSSGLTPEQASALNGQRLLVERLPLPPRTPQRERKTLQAMACCRPGAYPPNLEARPAQFTNLSLLCNQYETAYKELSDRLEELNDKILRDYPEAIGVFVTDPKNCVMIKRGRFPAVTVHPHQNIERDPDTF